MKTHWSLLLLLIATLQTYSAQGQVTIEPEESYYTGSEGTILTVCLEIITTSDLAGNPFNIDLMIDGTAMQGSDFSLLSNTLGLTAINGSSCFNITLLDDNTVEENETVTIVLSSSNSTVEFENNMTSVTITNINTINVNLPTMQTVYVSVPTNVCIELTFPAGGNTVAFDILATVVDGSASINTDFTVNTQSLAVASDDISRDYCVLVTGSNTGDFQINWSASVSNVVDFPPNAMTNVFIEAYLPVLLSNNSLNVIEGDSVRFCIGLPVDAPTDMVYTYTLIPGTAGTDDYIGNDGSLTIAQDSREMCLDVQTIDDIIIESNEYFIVSFSQASIDNVTVYIRDNEVISLTSDTHFTVYEGMSAMVCFNLMFPSGGSDITFTVNATVTSNASETLGIDFNVSPDSFTIEPTNALNLERCLVATASDDGNTNVIRRSFQIEWTASTHQVISSVDHVVIFIDDYFPTLLNTTQINVTENEPVTLCIELPDASQSERTYEYTFTPGTATSEDFSSSSDGSVTIAANSSMNCFTITIEDDSIVEGLENFTVSFPNAPTINSVEIFIQDTDVTSIGFSSSAVTISENIGVYTAQLVTTNSIQIDVPLSISVSYRNGTAFANSDFTFSVSNPVHWRDMSSTLNISLTITDDTLVENAMETFYLSFSILNSHPRISTSITVQNVTIIDNDYSIIQTPSSVNLNATLGIANLCFTHTSNLASDYTLHYTVLDGNNTIAENNIAVPQDFADNICVTIDLSRYNLTLVDELIMMWSVRGGQGNVTVANEVTTIILVRDNMTISTTESPTSTTESPTSTSGSSTVLGIYSVIGIIVGVVAAGLCFLIMLVCIVCCLKIKLTRRGFYATNEDKDEAPQMLRYSASLRSLKSETVMPPDNQRDKDNEYMV